MFDYSAHEGYTRYASLAGRTVFITGGATGIGASLVEAFLSQGSAVAFVDVDLEAAQQLCRVLADKGLPLPLFDVCDVSDISALRASIHHAQQQLGNIQVLVNNAANDQRFETQSLTEAQWHQGLAVNLHPVFFSAQAVQPTLFMVDVAGSTPGACQLRRFPSSKCIVTTSKCRETNRLLACRLPGMSPVGDKK